MPSSPDIRFDVASVLDRGAREYQEDALATDFPMGADLGYAVLSDGMGGHAAGDVASKIVVTEVFAELKFQSGDPEYFSENIGTILKHAAVVANDCVRAHTANNPDTAGMGATLVAPIFLGDRLFWISIGDSPFFLYRGGRLKQLNEAKAAKAAETAGIRGALGASLVGCCAVCRHHRLSGRCRKPIPFLVYLSRLRDSLVQ